MDSNVVAVFNHYPPKHKECLLQIKQLIYSVAEGLPQVGEIEESLKWGQPTYTSKIGAPIRMDRFDTDKVAVFVHCQTTLIEDFRMLFQHSLNFSKNRAIVIDTDKPIPTNALSLFIEKALTYHAKK